jgi:hypothetical protein
MKGFVYILTTGNNSVLYTGVTSDLKEKIAQHKTVNPVSDPSSLSPETHPSSMPQSPLQGYTP